MVLDGSHTDPDWRTAGINPVGMPVISYQNTALRSSLVLLRQVEFAPESREVHKLPSRKYAMNRRPSLPSSFPFTTLVFPLCGWVKGELWRGVLMVTLPDI